MAQRKYCKNTVPGRQGRGKKYPARVRAEVVMANQLTKAGSTSGVDAVAGATMTSDAVFTAMDDCLSQAQ